MQGGTQLTTTQSAKGNSLHHRAQLPNPLPHSPTLQIEGIVLLCGKDIGLVRSLGDGVWYTHYHGQRD